MFKYALVFALAGGAALFTGCRADEEVDLAGYPETPVGATISGTSDRVATFEGTYDNDGVLNLAGSLSGEYTIALAQASPEETVVRVEPIITNVPAELVEISARELVIPAGSTTATVEVKIMEENYGFMENVFDPMTYELGVRVVEARGSQVPVVDGEAKMVIEKAAYVAVASLVGVEGNAVTFKRNFIDGAIVNEDPITYDVKVVVDRPVLEDTKFVVKSAGIPEGFAGDEHFTPAAEVTIPAGAKESDATTWSVTDDFLEANEELGTFPVQLTAELVGDTAGAVVDPEDAGVAISIVKKSDLLTFLSAADPSWKKYPTSGWTVQTNGSAWPDANTALWDGSSSTDIYTWSDPSLELTIDMKTSQWVAGFDIQAYGSIGYMGEYFELSTSEDGENWTPHGELRQAEAPNRGYGATNYVQLLKPCNARYVKWVGTKGSAYTPDITELYIYGRNE